MRSTFCEWFRNILTANVGELGPAHFTQPQQAIQYVECHDNATVFDYFQLEKEEIRLEERKAFTPRSSFGIIIPRCTFYPCWSRMLPTKGPEDNTYNPASSLNHLDWTSFQNSKKNLLFLKNWLLTGNPNLLRLKKDKRFEITVMSNGCLIIILSTRLKKIVKK